MDSIQTIKVNTEYISDIVSAREWIGKLEKYKLLACDFEAAVKYSPEQLQILNTIINTDKYDFFEKTSAAAVLKATALDHPAHVKITHCSVAWSDNESVVFILDSDEITNLVLDWLVSTDIKQVWHNACYDYRLMYYHTGKFPKNFEDSQIFAKTVFNHTDTFKSKTGLKELAGAAYGAWGIVEDDYFTLENMYEPRLLHYAATDACATFWVWDRLVTNFQEEGVVYPDTTEDYSPWSQLPAPNPKTTRYSEAHFYHYTAKWLIRDTVRIMMNGLPINLERVRDLELHLDSVLLEIDNKLANNPAVKRFLDYQYEVQLDTYKELQKSKLKSPLEFLKVFDSKNAVHRCFYMDAFAERVGLSCPTEKLDQGCSKWSIKTIRNFVDKYPVLQQLLNHEVNPSSPIVIKAMKDLSVAAATKFNSKYKELISKPKLAYPTFNAASPKQKAAMFEFLGYSSDTVSAKTGADSWDRSQVEQLNKTLSDEDEIEFTQCLIDHSFAAIVRNNFVAAFYRYTLEGVLHGNYVLLGTKTARFTSKNPNLLNTPSSRSIFSKPVKNCFQAPKGFVVGGIDYSALEDRVMANLSEDTNKLNVFLKDVDSHCLSAMFYWPEEATAILGDITDSTEAAFKFKALVEAKDKAAKELRDKSKPISFGLKRGSYRVIYR